MKNKIDIIDKKDQEAKVKKTGKRRKNNAVSFRAEIIIHIILALFCLFCIIPFVFVIIISFTSESSIAVIGYSFRPVSWSLDAYNFVKTLGRQLWVSYFNSFYVTILGTFLSVSMVVLYSYALFRVDFKYRRFFTFFCFFTMIFGGGLVPTVVVSKNLLGLNNNYAALIVPLLLNPFNVIVMRTFFQGSVPMDLIEAASIDGSGEYYTLLKIVLPISKPGIATVALLTALVYWNDWFLSLLYIESSKYHPLQYLLMKMQAEARYLFQNASSIGPEAMAMARNIPSESLRMALVVLIVIPIAMAYPFFQRYIISGLTIGSVKG